MFSCFRQRPNFFAGLAEESWRDLAAVDLSSIVIVVIDVA
jgi:hypothetical protein